VVRTGQRETETTIRAKPIELYATEQSALRPLPLHIPIPYVRVTRVVDDQGYINLHTNRYSVDETLIDRELVVHETQDQVRIFDGHTLVCEHVRAPDGADKRGRWMGGAIVVEWVIVVG
jgi:hypothetical protein